MASASTFSEGRDPHRKITFVAFPARLRRDAALFSKFLPTRIPILYVILSVLVLISVVPMYFYSANVQSSNRQALITNERMLQNTLALAIADDISQHQESFRLMQQN